MVGRPAILGQGAQVVGIGRHHGEDDAAIGAAFAFVAALGALHFMMRLLRSVSFTPYVIYRIILGAILLAIAYT